MKFVLGTLAFVGSVAAAVVELPVRYHAATDQDHVAERDAMIDEINNTPGVLWKAARNDRFNGAPVGASKSLCGVKAHSEKTVQTYAKKAPALTEEQRQSIPTSFDSEANWPMCKEVIGDIRDQSNCGCCWAFGGAEAASDRLCIATQGKTKLSLSAQDLCFCASSDGCNGGDLFTPWQYIQSQGIVTGGQFNATGPFGDLGLCSSFSLPHCHHHGPQGNDPYPAEGQPGCPSASSPQCPSKCDSDAKAPHTDFNSDKYAFDGLVMNFGPDADSIAAEIMARGPVEAAFTVYSDFENYAGGIYHHVSGTMAGGHAIRIVGWGEENGTKYWKVANSWNPYWGENGYFRIVRGTNECNIEGQVTANSPESTWGKK